MENKFVKCTHMDVETFISFIENHLRKIDGDEIFINRVDKKNDWTVSANVFVKEKNPTTKVESLVTYNFHFIDDEESQNHFACIDLVSGISVIPSANISEAWNNFLKNQTQKQSQSTEAQPE